MNSKLFCETAIHFPLSRSKLISLKSISLSANPIEYIFLVFDREPTISRHLHWFDPLSVPISFLYKLDSFLY